MIRRKLVAGGALLVLGLSAAACPEEDTDAPEQEEQETDGDAVQIEITATDYAFEVEEQLEGGLVELTLTNDGENAHEAMLWQVPDDYEAEQFADDFDGVEEGGPIPDDLQSLTGIEAVAPGESDTATISLPEGTYLLVCALTDEFEPMGGPDEGEPGEDAGEPGDGADDGEDAAEGDGGADADAGDADDGAPNGDDDTAGAPADEDEDADGEGVDDQPAGEDDGAGADADGAEDAGPEDTGAEGRPAEGIAPEGEPHYEQGMLQTVEVEGGAGTSGADLPEEDGRIEAFDYGFEISELQAGSQTFAFENSSDNEFHHAVVMGFPEGVDEDEARDAFDTLMASEEDGGPPPEGTPEPEPIGNTQIFGPAMGGLFDVELESGRTYAFICFIHDRAGGPPHAFAHDMVEFATVE